MIFHIILGVDLGGGALTRRVRRVACPWRVGGDGACHRDMSRAVKVKVPGISQRLHCVENNKK